MPRYEVVGIVTGGKHLGYYEAASAEEAERAVLAEHGGPISLCHECSRKCEDATIEEANVHPVDDEGAPAHEGGES